MINLYTLYPLKEYAPSLVISLMRSSLFHAHPTNKHTAIPPIGKNIYDAIKSNKSNIDNPKTLTSLKTPKDNVLGTDNSSTPAASMIVAFFLSILNSSVRNDTETSNNEIVEVIAAIPTSKKNIDSKKAPNGIDWNTAGKVINISDGPDCGSNPNAKTAGNITTPAINAITVSAVITWKDSETRFSSLFI